MRRTSRYTLGICGRVSVTVWHAAAQVADFDVMEPLLLAQAAVRGPLGSIVLVEKIDLKTPPELRDRIVRFASTLHSSSPWGALVLKCDSFATVAMYAVLNVVNLLSGAKNPPHTSRSVAKAVDWLMQHDLGLVEAGQRDALVAAIERFGEPAVKAA